MLLSAVTTASGACKTHEPGEIDDVDFKLLDGQLFCFCAAATSQFFGFATKSGHGQQTRNKISMTSRRPFSSRPINDVTTIYPIKSMGMSWLCDFIDSYLVSCAVCEIFKVLPMTKYGQTKPLSVQDALMTWMAVDDHCHQYRSAITVKMTTQSQSVSIVEAQLPSCFRMCGVSHRVVI